MSEDLPETTPDFEPYFVVMKLFEDECINDDRVIQCAFFQMTSNIYSKLARYTGQIEILMELFGDDAPKSMMWPYDGISIVNDYYLDKYDFFPKLAEDGIAFLKDPPSKWWGKTKKDYVFGLVNAIYMTIDFRSEISWEFYLKSGKDLETNQFYLRYFCPSTPHFDGKLNE